MPLFLGKGCFPMDFQEVKRPFRTKSGKRPIKVGKQPIKEGKRPIKAMVLVGISVGCLMGCFRSPPLWRKTAPLKRPIKRSMKTGQKCLTWKTYLFDLIWADFSLTPQSLTTYFNFGGVSGLLARSQDHNASH